MLKFLPTLGLLYLLLIPSPTKAASELLWLEGRIQTTQYPVNIGFAKDHWFNQEGLYYEFADFYLIHNLPAQLSSAYHFRMSKVKLAEDWNTMDFLYWDLHYSKQFVGLKWSLRNRMGYRFETLRENKLFERLRIKAAHTLSTKRASFSPYLSCEAFYHQVVNKIFLYRSMLGLATKVQDYTPVLYIASEYRQRESWQNTWVLGVSLSVKI